MLTNSIVAASWYKHPDRRSPNQSTATLKVACTNPNQLLTSCIQVDDHLVNVRKNIYILIRYVKCQELYSHIQDSCIGVEKCSNCTSKFHSSNKCDRSPACVSYNHSSQYPSTLPSCPSFMRKCDTLDEHFPKNTMLYFPSRDCWTWTAFPTNPPPPQEVPPPLQ